NGLGVGIADFTTRRLYDKLDLARMYTNGLTAGALGAIKIPIVLDSDRQVIPVALHSVGHGLDARVAIVRSTLDLETMWVSEALVDEVARKARLEALGPPAELAFGGDGRLSVVSDARTTPNVMSTR